MEEIHTILLATNNPDKAAEIKAVLESLPFNVKTLQEYPQIDEIEETGKTLLENSLIKARTVHGETGLPVIADDTGLEVDALGGAPGVYSARFAGEDATYAENVAKLLKVMSGIPTEKRTAQFRSVVSYVDNERELWTDGVIKGSITEMSRGTNGFGYDPVFLVPELNKTYAELSDSEKNLISHRGLALQNLCILLRKSLVC